MWKRLFLLSVILSLFNYFTQAQIADGLTSEQIKALKIEIVFGERYKYEQNAKSTWVFKQKRTGNTTVIDTVSVFLKRNNKIKLKNEMLVSYEGDCAILYTGDSIFSKGVNGKESYLANKNYRKSLIDKNNLNPYFKRIYFFRELMNAKTFSTTDTTFVFTYQKSTKEVDRKITYTFLKKDTSLVKYKLIFSPKVDYLSYIVEECHYLTLEKDLPNFSLIDSMPDFKPKLIRTYASNAKLKLEVGETFPNMNLSKLQGDSIHLKTLAAKYYLLDFWYIGCVPCMKALPYLEDIHVKYPQIEVLGINVSNKLLNEVEAFAKKNSVEYKMFSKSDFKYSIRITYPTFVLLDKDLNILYVKSGFHKSLIDDIDKYIN